MELRHLRYFVAVSESLHFGEAASKLRISQPSLSQQIRQLEIELQTSLLRRTKRRVELTEAGQLFLEEARDILARADRAAIIARRASRGDGRLRIGAGYCMDQSALVRSIALFNRRRPSVRVELQSMAVPSQLMALRNEWLDIGFVRSPPLDPLLSSETIVSEPLIVAMPRTHRFVRRGAVALSSLADEPFVLTARELVPVYHDIVLRTCREAGFVPKASHEGDQLHVLLAFVGAGCGVALVPAFARRLKPRHVVFAPLRPSSTPNLETVVVWRRNRNNPPAILTEFVQVVRRVLGRMD